MTAFLRAHPVGMVQTRTLNIDPTCTSRASGARANRSGC